MSDIAKSGMKFSFTSLVNYGLGHSTGTLEFVIDSGFSNHDGNTTGKFYTRNANREYTTLGDDGKFIVSAETQ
jgi:hypothetical protein